MKSLIMNGTDDTPAINFDIASGVFEISGRSLPEEVINFYAPVIDWIEQYALNPKENSLLKLKLVYFNSASQRYLLEVLNSFEKILHTDKKVTLEWHYHEDDEEMREAGEEYQDLVNIPFTFHTY
ncbi:MAG: DUF1987 domain-containing protein [Bacteroidales bacterium]